jgi:predicted RNase H-like HicB family nuclease
MATTSNTVRFAVVIVKTEDGYAAAVPDLLGCAVNGRTVGLAQHAIRLAAHNHVARLREQGLPLPTPSSQIGYVEVSVN